MHKDAVSILLLSILCWSTAVWSAGPMKAGLWEMTIKSDAMKSMPRIPPEQLEKMRQMGVNVPQIQDGAIVTKVCVSQEVAERDQPPQMHQGDAGCQSKNFHRNGNEYTVDIVCDGPRLRGQGTAKGKHLSGESFSSTYDFKGTVQGRAVNQHQESSGKCLSADCGDVRPFDLTKTK
jgi:hypothetical protein